MSESVAEHSESPVGRLFRRPEERAAAGAVSVWDRLGFDALKRKDLAARLEPQRVYCVVNLQELLGIPVPTLIEAAAEAQFARYLGEQAHMHLLGVDVQDWLEGRPPWRSDITCREQADTVGHRCRRVMNLNSARANPSSPRALKSPHAG